MNPIQSAFTIMTVTALLATVNLPTIPKDSSVIKVFAGSTPCDDIIRPLHKISRQADCALVEWKLVLYHDPTTLGPTTYQLTAVNRFVVKETNMYSQPGAKTETEGKWTIVRGTKTNPNAIVYQLDPGEPHLSISFLKLSDNLLHLLDQEGNLMIGNAAASYTLNRVAN
jgi:hypothetical protein